MADNRSYSQDKFESEVLQSPNASEDQIQPPVSRKKKILRYRSVSDGYWVAFLLPIALYVSDLDLERETITAVTIIAVNTFLLCLFRWLELNLYVLLQRFRRISIAISGVILTVCFANGGDIYEVASYLALNFTFPYIFYNLIKHYPRSFSFGEGVLVTSAFAYRFWGASQSLPFPQPEMHIKHVPEDDIVAMFVQLVFFGTLLTSRLLLLLQKPWKLFILEEMLCLWSKYCIIAFFTRMHTQNDEVSLFLMVWPFKFLFANTLRVRLILSWAVFSILTGLFLIFKAFFSQKTTTFDRKVFHIAIVAVFLPGIVWDFQLIYCCSCVVFFIFILIEALRVLKVELLGLKFGEIIDENVRVFRDHQDEGHLLLTPIYLLAGCSLPIWLTDLNDANSLTPVQYAACIAGILSIGIGDMFASIGGTYFGRIRWKGSRKTVEGTVCCILAQLLFGVLIFVCDLIPYDVKSVVGLIAAICINAVIEGKTDQIDNLVLPLVTFIIIHGVSLIFSLTKSVTHKVQNS